MRVVGQYDTSGKYIPYKEAQKCYRLGKSLCDEDGFVLAVMDEYGDWVSPSMHALGLKSRIKVEGPCDLLTP